MLINFSKEKTDMISSSLVIIYFRKVVSDVKGKSSSQKDSKQNIFRIIGSVWFASPARGPWPPAWPRL